MGEVNELDGRAHADPLGQRRRLAHQKFRHRQRIDLVDIDRLAMMLADIGVAEAELVGEDDLGEVFFVSLCGGGVRAKTVRENSEFHLQFLNARRARYDPGRGLTTRARRSRLVACRHGKGASWPRCVSTASPAPARFARYGWRKNWDLLTSTCRSRSATPARARRNFWRSIRTAGCRSSPTAISCCSESLAITLYLAKKYRFGKLYPAALRGRGQGVAMELLGHRRGRSRRQYLVAACGAAAAGRARRRLARRGAQSHRPRRSRCSTRPWRSSLTCSAAISPSPISMSPP